MFLLETNNFFSVFFQKIFCPKSLSNTAFGHTSLRSGCEDTANCGKMQTYCRFSHRHMPFVVSPKTVNRKMYANGTDEPVASAHQSPRAFSRLEASGWAMPVKSENICMRSPVLPRLRTLSRKSCPVWGMRAPRRAKTSATLTASTSVHR